MTAPSIVFQCKGFRLPFWLSFIILLQASMALMFGAIMLGLPAFFVVLVFIFSLVMGIGVLGAGMQYSLVPEGIIQELFPLKWSLIKLRSSRRFFYWKDIKSYESGNDMSRSLQSYHYLYISLHKYPFQLRLSDHQASAEQLQAFEHAFVNAIETGQLAPARATNTTKGAQPTASVAVVDKTNAPTLVGKPEGRGLPVKRVPAFYETRMAHVIFWLLAVAFVVIGYGMVVLGYTNPTNIWRIGFVVIPGMGYYAWRLYGRGRTK